MSSFVRFVLRAKDSDSALGDIARDILADKRVKRHWCYKTVVKYMATRNASDLVFFILDEINFRYMMDRNSTRYAL